VHSSWQLSSLMNVRHLSPEECGCYRGCLWALVSASWFLAICSRLKVDLTSCWLAGGRSQKDKRVSERQVACVSCDHAPLPSFAFALFQRFMWTGTTSWQAIKKQLMKSANSASKVFAKFLLHQKLRIRRMWQLSTSGRKGKTSKPRSGHGS